MSKPWSPIKITGLAVEKTQPSSKADALRLMHLTLSDMPPTEWVVFFDAERKYPRHNMWRDAEIQGDYIVVDCVPEEIERHLADLKEDVSNANAKYENWATKEGERMIREVENAHEEKKKIADIASRLKFD